MGYRSEWCLLVAGPEKTIESFVDELTRIAASVKEGEDWSSRASCAKTVFDCRLPNRHWPNKAGGNILAIWHDDSTKCYGKWDSLIRELLRFAREKLGLKAAYGRIGDELDDIEFCNDCALYVPYRRDIDLNRLGESIEDRCEHGMFHTGAGACPKCEGS